MTATVEVLGVLNVKKFLDSTQNFDRRAAYQRSARIVTRNAKLRAPFKTGHLRRNIEYESTDKEAEIGVSLTIVPYAWYQEAGTSKMPAHPYLRPGLKASRKAITAIFQDELDKATKKGMK